MALTLTDTTYAGEAASGFIVKAITGAQTIQGGHVYVKDGIRKKFTIPRMTVSDIIQDRAATPTTGGTITVTGQVLEPADFMVYNEFNPRDFEDHWIAQQLSPDLIDRRLPVSAESTIIQEHLKVVANHFDKLIWQGDTDLTSNLKYFDGIVKKLTEAAANVISSPAALTTSNLQAKLELVVDALPAALKYDPTVKIFMNYKTAELYRKIQVAQTNKGVDFTKGAVWEFAGYPVVRIAGMPDDCIVMAKGNSGMDSNLWLGIDSTMDGEGNPSSIKFSPLQANSEKWFLKMLMKMDVQIGFPDEAVLYYYTA
jgi:hypothetical protein